MKDTNKLTIQSYEAYSQDYLDSAQSEPAEGVKTWIQSALSGMAPNARILELGSGSGCDATYMESLGYEVECSEATQSFVSHLLEKGFLASKINILTDPIMSSYDLVFANAVMIHFTRDEMLKALKKIHTCLKNRGRVAFSVQKGMGEEWTSEKYKIPRYYHYWNSYDLEVLLEEAGYSKILVNEDTTPTDDKHPWLFVMASK